jgi:hypothetical protein
VLAHESADSDGMSWMLIAWLRLLKGRSDSSLRRWLGGTSRP